MKKPFLLLFFVMFWAVLLHSQTMESITFSAAASNNDNFQPVVGAPFGASLSGSSGSLEISFTSLVLTDYTGQTGTVTHQGYTYNTIGIGNQVWMAENLRYLPTVVGPGTGSNTAPYYYVYGYDDTDVNAAKATTNYQTYGVLYNWTAAQTACPTGWHLPSDAEWTQLTDFVGGVENAGTLLKSQTGWNNNGNGTDQYGFTALPGGYRNYGGNFYGIGYYGYWWSASENVAYDAWFRHMSYSISYVFRNYYSKELGFSVRCVRD